MPEGRITEVEFQNLMLHLDAQVKSLEKLPWPEVQEQVFSMLKNIDTLHRVGLNRLVDLLRQEGQENLLDLAGEDPVLRALLVLYDLVPADPILQAEKALEVTRPYIHSHGGEVEVLDVEDGIVHIRLSGSCHGCAGSGMTLQRGIEAALREHLPGFKGIQVHEPVIEFGDLQPNGLITFADIQSPVPQQVKPDQSTEGHARLRRGLNAPNFMTVARVEDLPPGTMVSIDLDGMQALVANVDGEIFAVGELCPDSSAPLSSGRLDGASILCPWHGEVYDVRSGKCLDPGERQDNPRLPVFPVAILSGEIRIAVNVSPQPPIMELRG
jgi:nitrite reductase/ring-hydroxylating ferredoxin subunit/Fe-S cluster biogenesis protein NfuA